MQHQIRWSGAGDPILLLPGWNTTAAAVLPWIPESFLQQFRCGILEWPGLGAAAEAPLPESLETFLDELQQALPQQRVAVVGFCLGGIAAWAFAQRFPGSVRCSFLVESPQHFPLVLTPLLVPGLRRCLLGMAKGTPVGRYLVRRAILRPEREYPRHFLERLFDFEAKAALHYLRLFKAYGESLGFSREPLASARPCWQLVGEYATGMLAPAWGHRHSVRADLLRLEGVGHFPAVEAPDALFGHLQRLLSRA